MKKILTLALIGLFLAGCATTAPGPPRYLESRAVPLPQFTVIIAIAPDAQALIDQQIGCFKIALIWLNPDGSISDTAEIPKKMPYEELIMQIHGGMMAAHEFALIETRNILIRVTQCGRTCGQEL